MAMPTTTTAFDENNLRGFSEFLYTRGLEAGKTAALPQIVKIDTRNYLYDPVTRVLKLVEEPPRREMTPDVFSAFSLAGLVKYIQEDPDGHFAADKPMSIVHVIDEHNVAVETPIQGYYKERKTLAGCIAFFPEIEFNTYMDTESFQICLQSCFVQTDAIKNLLKFAGRVRTEQSMQTADDGVSQKVTVQTGVVTCSDVTVVNPVPLCPMRTFCEVDQPTSNFVLRVNEKGSLALFEGDGGAWKVAATRSIVEYLTKKLEGCNVTVIG